MYHFNLYQPRSLVVLSLVKSGIRKREPFCESNVYMTISKFIWFKRYVYTNCLTAFRSGVSTAFCFAKEMTTAVTLFEKPILNLNIPRQ